MLFSIHFFFVLSPVKFVGNIHFTMLSLMHFKGGLEKKKLYKFIYINIKDSGQL